VDVVLSHYTEEDACVNQTINAVKASLVGVQQSPRIFVYSKGPRRDQRPRWLTSYFENKGREGDTFLTYIIEKYEELPDAVLFSQVCPQPFEQFLGRLAVVPWLGVGAHNLGPFQLGTCDGTEYYPMHRLHDIYAATHNGTFCPNGEFLSFMTGSFIVSRARIRRNSLDFYKYIRGMLHANSTHFIHQDLNDVKTKNLHDAVERTELNGNANYFSYELERAWVIIFDCMWPTPTSCDNTNT
jgi:hypothetical protein